MENQCPNCGFPCPNNISVCPNCHHLLSSKTNKLYPPIIKDPPKINPPGSPLNEDNFGSDSIYIDPEQKNGPTPPSKKKFRPLF